MKTDKNTWKGFFFFFLRLITIVIVVIGLFFAYEFYKDYRFNQNATLVLEALEDVKSSLQ